MISLRVALHLARAETRRARGTLAFCVLSMLSAVSTEQLSLSPMISARIAAVNGRSVDQSGVARDDVQRSWEDRMRTREYFVSYREELLSSESLTIGQFWSGRPEQQDASLDRGLGQALGIQLGDTLALDIGGLPLEARVTSFRDIHWQALRPNSMILLSPGEIEAAPKMMVAFVRVPSAPQREALQAELVARYPNLSVVDAAEAAQTVLAIVSRISHVLTALGTLALLVGAVILGGAVAAGRFARQKEAMLFKVLGASRADLRWMLGAKYALLALLGTLAGWFLAEAIGRVAVPRLFDAAADVPYGALPARALGVAAQHAGGGVRAAARLRPATARDFTRRVERRAGPPPGDAGRRLGKAHVPARADSCGLRPDPAGRSRVIARRKMFASPVERLPPAPTSRCRPAGGSHTRQEGSIAMATHVLPRTTLATPAHGTARRIGAVFAGLFTIFAVTTTTDAALHAAGIYPVPGLVMSQGLFLLASTYRVVYGVLGCYVTARLAPARPLAHALVLGVLGTLISIAGAFAMWDKGPGWYSLAVIAMALPCAWLGGKLRLAQLARKGH
jgi:hypothetical protein